MGALILPTAHALEAGPARLIAGSSGLKEAGFEAYRRRESGLQVAWAHRSVRE